MTFHKPDFCRGIAMVLQGESLKAGCYVSHNPSLGGLRERIVRRLIRDQTPNRFEVDTGLIHCPKAGNTSRQCDILIHESGYRAPLYRWEDFVVVHRSDARAVVEVKSTLDESTFSDLLNVHGSLVEMALRGQHALSTQTYGYALGGVTFSTFVEYLQRAVQDNRLQQEADDRSLNWPLCVAVQERNYFGVRPLCYMAASPDRPAFCAIDLTKMTRPADQPIDGLETGYFIEIYGDVLADPGNALNAIALYGWFNAMPVSDEGKVWITVDGQRHTGNISFK